MDDNFKKLSFKDFVTVDYTKTGDEYLAYQAQKRHRGVLGDDYTPEDGEKLYEGEETEIDEVMSRQARLKAGQRKKRMSKRIQMAKKRALKRAPTMDVIKKRAQKQARDQMYQKWTKGVPKSDLSIGRRAELEKRLKKAKPKVDRLAKKLVPTIRTQDRERRAGAKKDK